jgi:hypothetical protein
MDEQEDYWRGSEGAPGGPGGRSGPGGPGGPGGPSEPGGTRPKRHIEDRLDDLADRFSKVMSDGARRVEDAFDKGMQSVKENPDLASGRFRSFFKSPTGGMILVIVGLVWFFYTVGLFDKPVFPILLILVGLYLMYRNKRPS